MMIDLGLVQRIHARVRELFSLPDERTGLAALRLREHTLWPMKDMPWYPCIPKFRPEDLELLRGLRRDLSDELGSDLVISDGDIVYLALRNLQLALKSAEREDKILRLGFRLAEGKEKPGLES